MKKVLILISLLTALLYSCAGEKKGCDETGCDVGMHCVIEQNLCVTDCTQSYCDVIAQVCNPKTKECEVSCKTNGCENGFICDISENKCVVSCIDVQCDTGLHCNTITKLCDQNCNDISCDTSLNEVCDPESHTCMTKATNACTSDSCIKGSHCNTTTGYCVGGCADISCADGDICNPDLLRCVHPCTAGSCRGESFCNLENKLCQSFTDYPSGPYGKKEKNRIKNLSWNDTNNKLVSLKKLHSMYVKTGYPRVIILVESAGWCSPCRQEAPTLGTLFKDKRLDNGLERVAVIQTVVDDNVSDGVMANPNEFAKSWKEQYALEFPVVGDNGRFALQNGFDATNPLPILENYNVSGSIPFNMVINAKTMEIESLESGTDDVLSGLISKIREIEKAMLCTPLNCEAQGSYCIYKNDDGTAKCN